MFLKPEASLVGQIFVLRTSNIRGATISPYCSSSTETLYRLNRNLEFTISLLFSYLKDEQKNITCQSLSNELRFIQWIAFSSFWSTGPCLYGTNGADMRYLHRTAVLRMGIKVDSSSLVLALNPTKKFKNTCLEYLVMNVLWRKVHSHLNFFFKFMEELHLSFVEI